MRFFDLATSRFPLPSVADYRLLAQKRLPRPLFDFIDGGAFEEGTLRRNREDFQNLQLRKRVLKDVSHVDTRTELFGQKLAQPLILAPVGFAGVYARRGEVQAARAAEKAGVPFSLSCVSICSIEEVRQATNAPFWFQFNLFKEKEYSLELLKRAEAAGCPLLLLAVDMPTIGARHRYMRSSYSGLLGWRHLLQSLSHPGWFLDVRLRGGPLALGNLPQRAPRLADLPAMRQWMRNQLHPGVTWKDLDWIRANWRGKIVLKGILDREDARMAAESGVDGIIVSNHGGRHLDSIPSTISILPEMVAAAGRMEVVVDGGISSGLDVVKALALGARACMIGRAWAFALAARGEQGVSEVLATMRRELKGAMAHLGTASLREIDHQVLATSLRHVRTVN